MLIPIYISITITACGDFRDEPSPAQPIPTPQPAPQPSPQPQPIPQPHPIPEPSPPPHPQPQPGPTPSPQPTPQPAETESQRNYRMCESERLWALNTRLITINQYQIFQRRNFAPVFNEPGVRQSGIESWHECRLALQINGFIPSH